MDPLSWISLILSTVSLVCGLLGNLNIIYVIYKHSRGTGLGKFLCWLVISDLLSLLFKVSANYLFFLYTDLQEDSVVLSAIQGLSTCLSLVNTITLLLVLIDRYLAVTAWPVYSYKSPENATMAVMFVLWMTAGIATSIYQFYCPTVGTSPLGYVNNTVSPLGYFNKMTSSSGYNMSTVLVYESVDYHAVCFLLLAGVVAVISSFILRRLWMFVKKGVTAPMCCSAPGTTVIPLLKERRASRAIALMMLVQAGLWAGESTLRLISWERELVTIRVITTTLVGPLPHVLRPILLTFLSPYLRSGMVATFRHCRLKRTIKIHPVKEHIFMTNLSLTAGPLDLSLPFHLHQAISHTKSRASVHLSVMGGDLKRSVSMVSIISITSQCEERDVKKDTAVEGVDATNVDTCPSLGTRPSNRRIRKESGLSLDSSFYKQIKKPGRLSISSMTTLSNDISFSPMAVLPPIFSWTSVTNFHSDEGTKDSSKQDHTLL